jgi:hypothetical protein
MDISIAEMPVGFYPVFSQSDATVAGGFCCHDNRKAERQRLGLERNDLG